MKKISLLHPPLLPGLIVSPLPLCWPLHLLVVLVSSKKYKNKIYKSRKKYWTWVLSYFNLNKPHISQIQQMLSNVQKGRGKVRLDLSLSGKMSAHLTPFCDYWFMCPTLYLSTLHHPYFSKKQQVSCYSMCSTHKKKWGLRHIRLVPLNFGYFIGKIMIGSELEFSIISGSQRSSNPPSEVVCVRRNLRWHFQPRCFSLVMEQY